MVDRNRKLNEIRMVLERVEYDIAEGWASNQSGVDLHGMDDVLL